MTSNDINNNIDHHNKKVPDWTTLVSLILHPADFKSPQSSSNLEKTETWATKSRTTFALDVAKIAIKHHGYPYGEFVRELPSDISRRCRWKNMNLWFKTKKSLNDFFNDLKLSLPSVVFCDSLQDIAASDPEKESKPFTPKILPSTKYPFDSVQKMVVWNRNSSTEYHDAFCLDIVISSHFPVYDFDVNCLFMSGIDDRTTDTILVMLVESGLPYRFRPRELLNQIVKGVAFELEEFKKVINDDKMRHERVADMETKGYKIANRPRTQDPALEVGAPRAQAPPTPSTNTN
jgi:hypothetical protein